MSTQLISELSSEPIVYQGERCVTLDLIDRMHERPKGTARETFRRRREKFTEGKHYKALALKEFRELGKPGLPNSESRGNPSQKVYLFTEKGYCLLVKTFDDDRAWAIQEELVDGYFRQAPAQRPVVADRAWSLRIAAYVYDLRDHIVTQHPGWWAVATELVTDMLAIEDVFAAHAYPLLISDQPDNSAGQMWARFRDGRAWSRPHHRDCPLLTPHGKTVFPHVYHPDELPVFQRWFRDTYMPEHFPSYARDKVRRDAARWARLGFSEPSTARLACAADEACLRVARRHARLSDRVRHALAQPQLFGELAAT